MKKMIESLVQQAKLLGAGEAHAEVETDDGTVSVVSVYIDQRPSYKILEDLIDWAEENDDEALLNKITQLAELN